MDNRKIERIRFQAEYLDGEVERLEQCVDLLDPENVSKARLGFERYHTSRRELGETLDQAESAKTYEQLDAERRQLQERFRDLELILSTGSESCVEDSPDQVTHHHPLSSIINELRRARMIAGHVFRRLEESDRSEQYHDRVEEIRDLLRDLDRPGGTSDNSENMRPQLHRLWSRISDAARELRGETGAR